ncbi:hypothetical protein FRC01_003636, partial [Tulasnella sp. 417]
PDSAKPTTVKIPEDTTTTDVEDTTTTDAQVQETTDATSFNFPTTTPTLAAASNTTSSASRTTSTPSASFVGANDASAVTLQRGYTFLWVPLLLVLGHTI